MRGYALIATHHKSGTSWMSATFREIGERTGIDFVDAAAHSALTKENCPPPAIVHFSHSVMKPHRALFEGGRYKIFHLIRDPRDMIISGAHYHQKSSELWLKKPMEQFAGQSYQDYLNSLPDDRSRYLAEMKIGGAIKRMANWNYSRAAVFECKYEDLMADTDMSLFTKAARHLGFEEKDLEVCKTAFWNNSIFGGKADRVGKAAHFRSGKTSQWIEIFDQGLANAFLEEFGDTLIKVGYESDNSWVNTLPKLRLTEAA